MGHFEVIPVLFEFCRILKCSVQLDVFYVFGSTGPDFSDWQHLLAPLLPIWDRGTASSEQINSLLATVTSSCCS